MNKRNNHRNANSDRPSRGGKGTAKPRSSEGPRKSRGDRDEDDTRGKRPPPRGKGGPSRGKDGPIRPGAGGRKTEDRPFRERNDRDKGREERTSGPGRSTGYKGTRNDDGATRGARRPPTGVRSRQTDASEGKAPFRPAGKRNWRDGDHGPRKPFNRGGRNKRENLPNPANEGLMRLNKYLAQAGIASRREADTLITSGAVTVNGTVVTELGTKVKPEDIVHFGGQKLSMEQKRYVLLNKPKDTITTTDDPQERHTVMSLIAKACTERLYPVGRLDRNTTGVLLLTNDGDLAKKLTHPSHGAEKIYHATLDRSITVEELHKLVEGVHLDDGPARADEVSFVGVSRREVGMKIHMGRNHIVRRMFQALGAEVVKLDRVMFAGLTKKELQRGFWRHLTEKEVTWLKQMRDAPKDTKEDRGGRRTRLSQGSE